MLPVAFGADRSVAGGAQRMLADAAASMARFGIDPTVVAAEPGPLVEWCLARQVAVVVAEHGWQSPDGLAASLSDSRPAAVVSLGASTHRRLGEAAAALGVPAVWWRVLTPRGRPDEVAAVTVATAAVVCPTPASAATQRILTPHAEVVCIPPGVDRPRGPGAVTVGGSPVVGMVARLDPAKGQDTFIAAVALLAADHPDIEAFVVGGEVVGHEAGYGSRLVDLAEVLGIGGRVRFVGHVESVAPWHRALAVEAFPSRHEAFGISLVEAMLLGVPVVASTTEGPTEILAGDGTGSSAAGLLVPPDDPRALAGAMGRILADARLAADLAARGRARAAEFSVDRMGADLARLLVRLAATGRAG